LRSPLLVSQEDQLSRSLARQAVGVKEVENGIWLISFINYDFGYIDLEERTPGTCPDFAASFPAGS
jgi:hypothetical protein